VRFRRLLLPQFKILVVLLCPFLTLELEYLSQLFYHPDTISLFDHQSWFLQLVLRQLFLQSFKLLELLFLFNYPHNLYHQRV